MKQTEMPASDALRTQLTTAEQQLAAWRAAEDAAAAKRIALREELAQALRAADPLKGSKGTAKVRSSITEIENELADARDRGDALTEEIATLRQRLVEVDTRERRAAAARAVANLIPLAKPIERAADDLVLAILELRQRAGAARADLEDVLRVMHPELTALDDATALIAPRAGASGPEAANAIAAILLRIAEAAHANLDAHVAFNHGLRGDLTMGQALEAGAGFVASRLGVAQ